MDYILPYGGAVESYFVHRQDLVYHGEEFVDFLLAVMRHAASQNNLGSFFAGLLKIVHYIEQESSSPILRRLADSTGVDDYIVCRAPALCLAPPARLVVAGYTLAITFITLTAKGFNKVFHTIQQT